MLDINSITDPYIKFCYSFPDFAKLCAQWRVGVGGSADSFEYPKNYNKKWCRKHIDSFAKRLMIIEAKLRPLYERYHD